VHAINVVASLVSDEDARSEVDLVSEPLLKDASRIWAERERRSDHDAKNESVVQSMSATGKVIAPEVTIREQPSSHGKPHPKKLHNGDSVHVMGQTGDWHQPGRLGDCCRPALATNARDGGRTQERRREHRLHHVPRRLQPRASLDPSLPGTPPASRRHPRPRQPVRSPCRAPARCQRGCKRADAPHSPLTVQLPEKTSHDLGCRFTEARHPPARGRRPTRTPAPALRRRPRRRRTCRQ